LGAPIGKPRLPAKRLQALCKDVGRHPPEEPRLGGTKATQDRLGFLQSVVETPQRKVPPIGNLRQVAPESLNDLRSREEVGFLQTIGKHLGAPIGKPRLPAKRLQALCKDVGRHPPEEPRLGGTKATQDRLGFLQSVVETPQRKVPPIGNLRQVAPESLNDLRSREEVGLGDEARQTSGMLHLTLQESNHSLERVQNARTTIHDTSSIQGGFC
ncbi:MAG: hypothetical protein CO184_02135, partial [Candidatus Zambryskibacteria bacterium CG_4_9_14_3_um_filter_40_16]